MSPVDKKLIEIMDNNRDKEQPCVGIFYYSPATNSLFGVVKKHIDECPQTGMISCTELHKYIWKSGFNKQKYKNNGIGPFSGDWKDTPRGRIFYDTAADKYIVCVGSWISQYDDIYELVANEFHLNEVDYEFEVKEHWEIGSGWGD